MTAAEVCLSRVARDLTQPGELAARIGVSHEPGAAGFLARVEKALAGSPEGVRMTYPLNLAEPVDELAIKVLDQYRAQLADWLQVLQNTSNQAESRPDSAALSRPDSVKVSGWQMGHCASVAAQLDLSFEHLPVHPLPLQNGACGSQSLIKEPEAMTTSKSAPAAAFAPTAHTPPAHYLRRLARSILIRAAVRGRISWFVALRMLALIEGCAA